MKIPRSYAVVIGVGQYRNLGSNLQLQYTNSDAESMYSTLISPEGGNYRAENVHLLIGPNATLENMQREIEKWLPTVARDADRVLIYFAGHGFVANGRAYLAPADYSPDRPAETGYSMEKLGYVIGSEIKAASKIILTDACHSGALLPGTDPMAVNRALLDLKQSIFSLTASRDRESSLESAEYGGGHGVFTYFTVKGLEGEADESCDGIVTADELAEYVHANVRRATNSMQNPTSERASYDPDLLMAYNPSKICAAQRVPEFGTLIFESNMDGVELFIDGESVGVVNKLSSLNLPGLKPGSHSIQAVKMGYEPDGPRDEIVLPGQQTTVSLRIIVRARHNKAAVEQFNSGFAYYQKGFQGNYEKAADHFQRALELDPSYSQAAMYLGRTHSALSQPVAAKGDFQRALRIDPDYIECQISYAGLVLDLGDMDESIRELTKALQRDRTNALGFSMEAQALLRKALYADGAHAAREAIRLHGADPEPHFWLAECLRLAPPSKADPAGSYKEAFQQYAEYLKLSDFDSKLAGKLSYYVQGYLIGLGKKTHAAQEDIWKDLRSIAYAGMGECERLQGNSDNAVAYYQRALYFDPKDPLIHFSLAVAFVQTAQKSQMPETLPSARKHFLEMLSLNPDLVESERARQYLAKIDVTLQQLPAQRR